MASTNEEADERDDPNEVRRFRSELEDFQSWAGLESSRRKVFAYEWIALFLAVVAGYATFVLPSAERVTVVDAGALLLIWGTTVGLVKFELTCANALRKVEDRADLPGSGSESPVAAYPGVHGPSTSGG